MDKLVFVKELKTGTTKDNTNYPIVIDQDNEKWNIFRQAIKLELNKAYLFSFVKNDRGFNDIQRIVPVFNIFKQEALKEVANKNDVIRNYSIAISYAINLAGSGQIGINDIFKWADDIYNALMEKADSLVPEQ